MKFKSILLIALVLAMALGCLAQVQQPAQQPIQSSLPQQQSPQLQQQSPQLQQQSPQLTQQLPQQQLPQQQQQQQQSAGNIGQDAASMQLRQHAQTFLASWMKAQVDPERWIADSVVIIPAVSTMDLVFGRQGFAACQKRIPSLMDWKDGKCEVRGVDVLRQTVIAECMVGSLTYKPTGKTAQNVRFGIFIRFDAEGKIVKLADSDLEGKLNQLVKTQAEVNLERLVMSGISEAILHRKGDEGEGESSRYRSGQQQYSSMDWDDDRFEGRGDHFEGPEIHDLEFQQQQGGSPGVYASGGGYSGGVSPRGGQAPSQQQEQQPGVTAGTGASGGGLADSFAKTLALIDDNITVRFINLPPLLNAMVDQKTELRGKQEVGQLMHKLHEFGELLDIDLNLSNVNFKRVFADQQTVISHMTIHKCHFAVSYTFNPQGQLVSKDIAYLGTW